MVEYGYLILCDKSGDPVHLIEHIRGRQRVYCSDGTNVVTKRIKSMRISETKLACKKCQQRANAIMMFWKTLEEKHDADTEEAGE